MLKQVKCDLHYQVMCSVIPVSNWCIRGRQPVWEMQDYTGLVFCMGTQYLYFFKNTKGDLDTN